MSTTLKFPLKLKKELWWLIISTDFNYSRISVAEHEINNDHLTLWLEDKQDYKNALDDCLQIDIPLKQFAKVIKAENLNSYEGTKIHPTKKFPYPTRITINEPIKWYLEDASFYEQQIARETLLKQLLTQLIETELYQEYL